MMHCRTDRVSLLRLNSPLLPPWFARNRATIGYNMSVFGDTDTGRTRANNEDAWWCDDTLGIYLLADGMGGHEAGEEASAIVIHSLRNELTKRAFFPLIGDLKKLLMSAIHQANSAVLDAVQQHPEWNGMGSTVVAAIRSRRRLHLANIGDSRGYLWRHGVLRQLSKDHSVAARLVEEGLLRPDELRDSDMRNRLTAVVGQPKCALPAYCALELCAGDIVLLCSDGLWDMVPDDAIALLLGEHPQPQDAVRALIAAANHAGGKDNITAVVLTVGDGK